METMGPDVTDGLRRLCSSLVEEYATEIAGGYAAASGPASFKLTQRLTELSETCQVLRLLSPLSAPLGSTSMCAATDSPTAERQEEKEEKEDGDEEKEEARAVRRRQLIFFAGMNDGA